jgi:hypothetical protein
MKTIMTAGWITILATNGNALLAKLAALDAMLNQRSHGSRA